MARVAYLSSRCMLDDTPQARADRIEHDIQFGPLERACGRVGVALDAVAWDDPGLDPGAYDAAVIGTTWDYVQRLGEFLDRLDAIDQSTMLLNPLAIVRWNADKGYLLDLAQLGVPIVPTELCDRADAGAIERAGDRLGARRVVVKPRVGACAWRQVLVDLDAAMPDAGLLPPGACLVQPYVESIKTQGEYSLVFLDGAYSHCARKVPRDGDYRIQSIFGGTERPHRACAGEIEVARAALDAANEDLLYGRVDLVGLGDGRLAVMELELIEPYLYPQQGPGFTARFAQGLSRRLGESINASAG